MKPGQRYKHFKGGEYEFITLATSTDDGEPFVIYRCVDSGVAYARRHKEFMSPVFVRGKWLQRFEEISG